MAMMLHIEATKKSVQRTIEGWTVTLGKDHILITSPFGTKQKVAIKATTPHFSLITKEVQVMTKNGLEYKTITVPGPEVPKKVKEFVLKLWKLQVMQ